MAQVKTDAEIEKISKACLVAADILAELNDHVKVGITTLELEEMADRLFREKGAIPAFKGYRGYRFATCLSINEEVVHGLPGKRVLKDGDILGVDVGAIVDGYYGDNAETFPVGKISAAAKRLISATRNALYPIGSICFL